MLSPLPRQKETEKVTLDVLPALPAAAQPPAKMVEPYLGLDVEVIRDFNFKSPNVLDLTLLGVANTVTDESRAQTGM